MTTKLEMWRGDDREFTFTITEDGAPMNLTDAVLRFTAKRSLLDADDAAVIAKSTGSGIEAEDPTTGVATLTLAAADTESLTGTAQLIWDLQVARGGSVRTVLRGLLTIEADATRTAP